MRASTAATYAMKYSASHARITVPTLTARNRAQITFVPTSRGRSRLIYLTSCARRRRSRRAHRKRSGRKMIWNFIWMILSAKRGRSTRGACGRDDGAREQRLRRFFASTDRDDGTDGTWPITHRCEPLDFGVFASEEAFGLNLDDAMTPSKRGRGRPSCERGTKRRSRTTDGTTISPVAGDSLMWDEDDCEDPFTPEGSFKLKGQWSTDEDQRLIELVRKYGVCRWSYIATALPGRVGKQCRERWNNHLAPDIKRGCWSAEEEDIFINAHLQLGNKWSDIAKTLEGRTENSVKNHWNATKRRKDGQMTTFRAYVLEVSGKQDRSDTCTTPHSKSRATTSDSLGSSMARPCASPSHSEMKDQVVKRLKLDNMDAPNSDVSTQIAIAHEKSRAPSVEMRASEYNELKTVLIDSKEVQALHEPILVQLPGNEYDTMEILNSHEQLTQDCVQPDETGIEVASYASAIPLRASLLANTHQTLQGLIDSVRNNCSVVSLSLTVKSGDETTLKRFGGNCYILSVSAINWEAAMQGVKLAVKFLKSSDIAA